MNRNNPCFSIGEYECGNKLVDKFLIDAFNSKDSVLFWSPIHREYSDINSLLSTLRGQVGEYLLFIAYDGKIPKAIYMAHSISYTHKRADVLVYVKPQERIKIGVFSWWVQFLMNLSSRGINRVFGKIFCFNVISVKAATQAGFEQCGILPDYVYIDGKPEKVIVLSRSTALTKAEKKWNEKQSMLSNKHFFLEK